MLSLIITALLTWIAGKNWMQIQLTEMTQKLEINLLSNSKESEETKKHLDHFLKDLQEIKKLEVLKPYPVSELKSEKDAGSFLNSRIPWGISDQQKKDVFAYDPQLAQNFEEWGYDWVRHSEDVKNIHLDLSFLRDLMKYDHWAVEDHSPLETNPEGSLPQLGVLNFWSKLRLLKVKDESDALSALEEVRHLARLSYTSELLLGNSTFFSLLLTERAILDYWEAMGRFHIHWDKVPLETLTALHRSLMFKSIAFLDFRVDDEVWNQIFKNQEQVPGICGLVNEFILANRFLYFLLKDHYPNRMKRYESLYSKIQTQCRMKLVHPVPTVQEVQGKFNEWKNLSPVLPSIDQDFSTVETIAFRLYFMSFSIDQILNTTVADQFHKGKILALAAIWSDHVYNVENYDSVLDPNWRDSSLADF